MLDVLDVLAWLSFVFVVAFTWRAYTREPGPGQSPRSAITEAWLNIAIGFSFNFTVNFLVLPLVGAHLNAGNNFAIGWIYTAVSILRQYIIRRWFNKRLHALAQRVSSGTPTQENGHA